MSCQIPRIGDATVTEVLVSPDMKHAQVQASFRWNPTATRKHIAVLEGAKTFLQRQLATRLTLFRIPELHFESDVAQGGVGRAWKAF